MHGWIRLTACLQQTTCRLGFLLVTALGFFLFLPFVVPLGYLPTALAFPCFLFGLFALPLCGAAPTFFAAAKKVGKESGSNRQCDAVHRWYFAGVAPGHLTPRSDSGSDKGLILPATLARRRAQSKTKNL
jgi:hypothetical protein